MHLPPPAPDERLQAMAKSGCLSLAVLIALPMSGLLLWFAVLRENLAFWRNSGGYPVILRELVYTTFYPLGLATTLGIALIGWALFQRSRQSPRLWLFQVLLLSVCAALVASAAVVAFSNNVQNLWNGAPLHYHQGEDTPPAP